MKSIFEAKKHFLSCDWGTSSFRLALVDKTKEEPIAQQSTPGGIKKLYNQWANQEKVTDRKDFYLEYLGEQIAHLSQKCDPSLTGLPLLVSGMASSSIGIMELPYTPVPFSLQSPDLCSRVVPKSDQFPHDMLLVSGLRTPDDVMRGEEIQLLGLSSQYELENNICILPGTHSKHAIIKQQEVVDFNTYMSGEIFELLSSHSILSTSVEKSSATSGWESFKKGVERAQKSNFLHSIFGIRINDLLQETNKQQNFDQLSGIVIGTELKALSDFDSDIYIVGTGPLAERYKIALDTLNLKSILVTISDTLVIKGHLTIVKQTS